MTIENFTLSYTNTDSLRIESDTQKGDAFLVPTAWKLEKFIRIVTRDFAFARVASKRSKSTLTHDKNNNNFG